MAPEVITRIGQAFRGKAAKRGKSRGVGKDEEVAKRRAIVKSNPDMTARELCELFDRKQVKLPRTLTNARMNSWTVAYRSSNYRGRIDTIISNRLRKN